MRPSSASAHALAAGALLLVLGIAAVGGRPGDGGDDVIASLAARRHSSPDVAVRALLGALHRGDHDELRALLGPAAVRLQAPGGFDGIGREAILRASDERLVLDDAGDGCVFVSVGQVGWRFPVPLAHDGDAWLFVAPESAACAHAARVD